MANFTLHNLINYLTRKDMKKILASLLGTIFPLSAFCTVGETFTVKTANDVDMTFAITSEGTVKTVKTGDYGCIDFGYKGDVVVPSTVSHNSVQYTVTEIGRYSFANRDMKSISLPSTITRMGKYGIYACRYLISLTIPKSVEVIEEGAIPQNPLTTLTVENGNKSYVSVDNVLFNKDKTILLQYACRLPASSYTIPNTVTRVANMAFDNCDNLVEVTIPESVTEIGQNAFLQCSILERVRIPASVTKIEEGAFVGPNHVKSIEVDDNNPSYTTVNGVLYTKDLSIIVCYPVANVWESYDIKDGTTAISECAFFSAKNLYRIIIPNTVTTIGHNAFRSCNKLQSIDVPTSVTFIGNQAFVGCINMTKAYFHSTVPPKMPSPFFSPIFGDNENLVVYVPYTSIRAYAKSPLLLSKVHIAPAIDWHDNHYFSVFCCVQGVDFSKSEGVTAYKVVKNPGYVARAAGNIKISTRAGENNSPVMLVKVDKAGPGDCVLLQAEPGKTYGLCSDDSAPNITDNLLSGSATEDKSIWSTDGDKTNFMFNGTEFVAVTGSESVSLGTGFLQIPTKDVPEGTTSLVIENIPGYTGITNIKANPSTGIYYNLQGIYTTPTHKGVYIRGGKKVVVY